MPGNRYGPGHAPDLLMTATTDVSPRKASFTAAARILADRDPVIARLSAVRGIGRWTAEMFLLFQLRRLDVWPVGDLGIRRGYGLAW